MFNFITDMQNYTASLVFNVVNLPWLLLSRDSHIVGSEEDFTMK